MAQFKFIPPGSLYSARSVQARTRNGHAYVLSSNQSVRIPDEELKDLQLKLDYHKQVLSEGNLPVNENHFLVFLSFRKAFPLNYFDLMFRNRLQTLPVSQEQFDFPLLSNELIKREEIVDKKTMGFILIVLLSVVLCFIQSFILWRSDSGMEGYPLYCYFTGFSFLGFLLMLRPKKVLYQDQFRLRQISYLLYSIVFLFAFPIAGLTFAMVILLVILGIGFYRLNKSWKIS
ncbi:MAG: hypothetical protein RIS20_2000 [Bacteroidota bacterium]|jgi:hypothetical protein